MKNNTKKFLELFISLILFIYLHYYKFNKDKNSNKNLNILNYNLIKENLYQQNNKSKNFRQLSESLDNQINLISNSLSSYIGQTITNTEYLINVNYYPYPEELPEEISYINLGECEEILRNDNNNHYDKLIIMTVIIFNKNRATDSTKIRIYSPDGKTLLDFSKCENIKISINSRLNEIKEINKTRLEYFVKQNVDIFNYEDEFFHDKCNNIDLDGIDYTLRDRKKNIYVNVSLCQIGCQYNNYYDLKHNYISCLCNSQNLNFDNKIIDSNTKESLILLDEEKKNIGEKVLNELNRRFNYKIVTCVKYFKKVKTYKSNQGFLFTSSVYVLLIISYIIYCCKSEKRLKFRVSIACNINLDKADDDEGKGKCVQKDPREQQAKQIELPPEIANKNEFQVDVQIAQVEQEIPVIDAAPAAAVEQNQIPANPTKNKNKNLNDLNDVDIEDIPEMPDLDEINKDLDNDNQFPIKLSEINQRRKRPKKPFNKKSIKSPEKKSDENLKSKFKKKKKKKIRKKKEKKI